MKIANATDRNQALTKAERILGADRATLYTLASATSDAVTANAIYQVIDVLSAQIKMLSSMLDYTPSITHTDLLAELGITGKA